MGFLEIEFDAWCYKVVLCPVQAHLRLELKSGRYKSKGNSSSSFYVHISTFMCYLF